MYYRILLNNDNYVDAIILDLKHATQKKCEKNNTVLKTKRQIKD